jgi:multimeric flavodoxin WrbA
MKLLTINGSPRAGSSTEILTERFALGFRSVVQDTVITTVRLNDLDIIPCQSCGFSPAPLPCIYRDDLYPYLLQLREADFLLIASPIYFDSVSSLTKLFIDRTNCLRPPIFEGESMRFDKSRLLNSAGAYILVGSEREKFDAAERVIGGMFVWCGIARRGRMLYAHGHSNLGAAVDDPQAPAEAFELGREAARSLVRPRT